MNRRNIIIAAGAVAAVIVLALVLRGSGNAVTESAEDFLSLAAAGKTAEAYESTDLTLQAALDKEKFGAALKELRIDAFKSVKWTKQDVVEEEAELTGTMTLKNGTTAPVELSLLQTEDVWRVSDLHWQGQGTSQGFQPMAPEVPLLTAPEPARRDQLPSKAGLRYLTTETILKLNEAIQTQNFDDFYDHYISKEYQKAVNPQQLHDLFYAFYEQKIDLSDVKNFTPIFDNSPSVDANGYFKFTGRYPTYPPTSFDIVYIFEDGMWKVFHVSVMR